MPVRKKVSVDASLRISTGMSCVQISGQDNDLVADLSPASAWRLRKHFKAVKNLGNLLGEHAPGRFLKLRVRVLGVTLKTFVM